MTDRTLLDRSAVARKLGITVEKFYRQRPDLEAEGFPAPAIGRMSGARWDPVAIDRWLDRKLSTPAPAASGAGKVEDWGAELDRNAAALAAGRRR